MSDKYKIMGHIYGALSRIYSGKSIEECRASMLDHLKSGDKIVFAGVGYGEDAIKAARRGADVTIVELSATMLAKFNQNLAKEAGSLRIRQVHQDILKFDEFGQFDMVVSNFFLNIFDRKMMTDVLTHMVKLGKPGANVVIGDFILPSGNVFAATFQHVYWFAANIFFWILAKNPVHKVYDYPEILQSIGLPVVEKRIYKLLNINCFWSIRAIKP